MRRALIAAAALCTACVSQEELAKEERVVRELEDQMFPMQNIGAMYPQFRADLVATRALLQARPDKPVLPPLPPDVPKEEILRAVRPSLPSNRGAPDESDRAKLARLKRYETELRAAMPPLKELMEKISALSAQKKQLAAMEKAASDGGTADAGAR